jgi:hypothetical protein
LTHLETIFAFKNLLHGSTPGKGCTDATFTLKSALQILQGHDQESWVLSADFVQAYCYTVNREMLWKILTILLGVPENLIEALNKLYKDVTNKLRVGEQLEQFLSTSRVKQGNKKHHPFNLLHDRSTIQNPIMYRYFKYVPRVTLHYRQSRTIKQKFILICYCSTFGLSPNVFGDTNP